MSPGARGRRVDLAAAAVRLARLLGSDECVLVGGLAVGVHGFVRATDDLDFITRLPLDRARERLRQAGIETRLVRGNVLDGGFDCLKGEIEGIPFDVLPPLVPIAWQAALEIDIGRGSVAVVDLDTLLQLKLRAGGAQNLLDAARLVLLHPATETRVRELATAYDALDRFETWLNDTRIRAQAREEAALERRRGVVKPWKKKPAHRRPLAARPPRGRSGTPRRRR